MDQKNLPNIIPTYNLSESAYNLVMTRRNSRDELVYCEGVNVINGWLIMKNVRIESSVQPTKDPIPLVTWRTSSDRIWITIPNKRGTYEKYYEILESRTVPLKELIKIDSYKRDQMSDLPEWCRVNKNDALNKVNARVDKQNKETLLSNHNFFSYIIMCLVENRMKPKKHRSFFKRLLPEPPINKEGVQKEIEENTRAFYIRNKIEYEGELIYNKEIAQEYYDRYGNKTNDSSFWDECCVFLKEE